MKEFFTDDKNMVVIAVVIVAIGILIKDTVNPEAAKLMANVFTGLFGIAVGRATK